jgi:hypothetical protein
MKKKPSDLRDFIFILGGWTAAIAVSLLIIGSYEFFVALQSLGAKDAIPAIANLLGSVLGAVLAGGAAIAAGLIVHSREQRAQAERENTKRDGLREIVCAEIKTMISWVTTCVLMAPYRQTETGVLAGKFFKELSFVQPIRIYDSRLLTENLTAEEIWDYEYIAKQWTAFTKEVEQLPDTQLDQATQQRIWQFADHIQRWAADILDRYGGDKFRVSVLQAKDDSIFMQTPPLVPLHGVPVMQAHVYSWMEARNKIARDHANLPT